MHTTDERQSLVEGVRDTLVEIVGIEERRDQLDADTELFGSLPELDSLSVLELATALETKFGVLIEDEDFTGEVFASIGSLADFIAARTPHPASPSAAEVPAHA